MSGLELASKKYELRCYKIKLFNLFICYKPNVSQIDVIDREILLRKKASTYQRDIWGSRGLPPEKFSKITCSRASENSLCVVGKRPLPLIFILGWEV